MKVTTRNITAHDRALVMDSGAVEKLRAMAGLSPAAMGIAVSNFERRLKKSQRGLVQLVPEAGGNTLTVRASSLTPTARSYDSLKGVEIPGYRIERLPALDTRGALEQSLEAAATALRRTFREPEDAQKWLRVPNPAFNGQPPLSALEAGKPTAISTVLNAARQGVAL